MFLLGSAELEINYLGLFTNLCVGLGVHQIILGISAVLEKHE